MVSKLDNQRRMNMKRNLNKSFAYIWVMTLVMMGGPAFGQRDNGGGNGRTQHVTVSGNVFGGGNLAPVAGNSNVIINQTDASIEKDVYGGGALANVGTDGDNSTTVQILDGIINGNVYGGGLGDSIGNGYFSQFGNTESVAAMVYGKVTVNIGAAPADLNNPNSEPTGNATLRGNVFGCNNVNGTPKDDVQVNIWRTAHTDDNKYPVDAQGHLTVTLDGLDVVDPDAQTYNNKFAINAVYGGGNKANYVPNRVTSGNPHSITVYVYGCEENTVKTVYGGGNAANVGTVGTSGITANTNILIDGGRFDRVFGGGNGYSADRNHDKPYLTTDLRCVESETERACEDYNPGANIYGTASTTIKGGLCRQVFGGSNQFGDITTVALSIDKSCEDLLIYESFGGANEAVISSNVETSLLCSTGSGDYHIGNFYGGSNMADIRGNVTLNVYGGTYTNVFGGSKGVGGTTNPVAANIVDNPTTTDIVEGNVTLNLHGGTMVNAFGGSDANGNISGNITVNLLQDGDCPLVVDTIYGGGQNAAYEPVTVNGKKIGSPVVNLWHGQVGEKNDGNVVTVPGCVFGGGKGNGAVVTGHPKVNIGDIEHEGNSNQITVLGHVFGGGNAAGVDGIDSVLMLKANSEVVNLFGGGNKAAADTTVVILNVAATVDTIFGGGNLAGLSGTAEVNVSAGTVRGGIYGGSNESGEIAKEISVNLSGGQVGTSSARANIHGGGYGRATSTSDNVEVNITNGIVYGDVYGGSALGDVNNPDGGDTTQVNILGGTIYGDIYGGGLGSTSPYYAAAVNGKVFVNIGSDVNTGNATISTYTVDDNTFGGNVFGCNNANGSPQDSVFVNIYHTAHTTSPINNTYPSAPSGGWTITGLASNSLSQQYAIQSVFGGGNEASYTPALAGSDPRSATVHVYGCQENTIKDVYGGGNAADVGTTGDGAVSANTFVIIDGGRINRVFGGGKGVAGGVSANIYGTATTTVYAGLIDSIFGGSNQNGAISTANLILASATSSNCGDKLYNQVFGGANVAEIAAPLSTTIECGVGTIGDIYGGSNLADITNDVVLNIRGGHFTNVFGGSKGAQGKPANISGNVELNLNGGEMVNAFGGSNVNGNIRGSITVNVLDTVTSCPLQVDTIYGAGQDAAYTPETVNGKKIVSPVVNLWHGQVGEKNDGNVVTVPGCVFGGGKGNGAVVTAHPKVIIGDTITTGDDASVHIGYIARVLGHVFGGGNKAAADSTVVMMTAGAAVDTIFGGGNLAGLSGAALVEVSAGTSRGGVYGGSNKSGNVVGDIAVNVTGGMVGTEDTQTANIHGGGYGTSTSTEGNVEVNIGAAPVAPSTTPTGDAVIWGDVYGGSADGSVNSDGDDHTWVTLYGGTINGSLYGGGLGINNTACNVNGTVKVVVNGGTVNTTTNTALTTGSVFGCNNAKGTPKNTVEVEINSTALSTGSGNTKVYALQGVYGGGNLAAYVPTAPNADYPKVTVNGCASSIKDVYGGGNAAPVPNAKVFINGGDIKRVFAGGNGENESNTPAHVGYNNTLPNPSGPGYGTGQARAEIKGGTIEQVFGGSNAHGMIRDHSELDIDKPSDGTCPMKIGEVYGGGNMADGNAGSIRIGCTGDLVPGDDGQIAHPENIGTTLEGIGKVYGGANQANITSDSFILLEIKSGIVGTVFGGNNIEGEIQNTNANAIQVKINKTGDDCGWYVGDVYGGGDQAWYGGTPVVRIQNGTVYGNVYGGGNNITGDNTTTSKGVAGSDVEMTGGSVLGGVYGGCNEKGSVTGKSLVKIYGGTVGSSTGTRADVFGGGLGQYTKVNGDVEVIVNETGSNETHVYGDVYGGSAKGRVNCTSAGNAPTSNAKTDVTLTDGTIHGNLYGGGLGDLASLGSTGHADIEANVYGPVTVKVNGGSVSTYNSGNDGGNVYGCNNYNGAPQASTSVVIYGGTVAHDVFGGGNLADATIATHVTVEGGTVSRDVYGGGALANTGATLVDITGGIISRDIYGGGLGDNSHSPSVNGTVTVNIGALTGSLDVNGFALTDSISGNATIGGSVYGCNNAKGSPQDNVTVNVYKTAHTTANEYGAVQVPGADSVSYAILNVFGGGNEADYTATGKTAKVNIYGCDNTIRRTFGGGNAAAAPHVETFIQGGRFYQVFGGGNGERGIDYGADITEGIDLTIHGGNVGQFFGGSNQNGTLTGELNTVVDNNGPCESNLVIDEFFCGGNFVDITGDLETTISCSDEMQVNNLYGGCNQANITGHVVLNLYGGIYTNVYGGSKGDTTILVGPDHINKHADIGGYVTLNLYGGTITNVYGGSNVNGNIKGAITVNVIDKEGDCPLDITNIYGGSNMTSYKPTDATIQSPVVNIVHAKNGISGNVYGGSKGVVGAIGDDVTTVEADPLVNIGYESGMTGLPETYDPDSYSRKTTIQGNVFGGGDAAKVEGNTEIRLNKGTKVIVNGKRQ